LAELAASVPGVAVRTVVADLGTDAGIDEVAELCASQPLSLLVNNAGVAQAVRLTCREPDLARYIGTSQARHGQRDGAQSRTAYTNAEMSQAPTSVRPWFTLLWEFLAELLLRRPSAAHPTPTHRRINHS